MRTKLYNDPQQLIHHDPTWSEDELVAHNQHLTKHIPPSELNSHMAAIYPEGMSAFVSKVVSADGELSYGVCFLDSRCALGVPVDVYGSTLTLTRKV